MAFASAENPPHALIDALRNEFDFKSDYKLGLSIGIVAPTLSKIRNRKNNVSDTSILIIHEKLGLPVSRIRELIKESEQQWEKYNGDKESDHSEPTDVGAGAQVAS